MTWRVADELLARVRRTAERQGRSMNDYVTAVLDVATDPARAGSEAEALRERLAAAGLLAPSGRPRSRPAPGAFSKARAAAGRDTPLDRLVDEGR